MAAKRVSAREKYERKKKTSFFKKLIALLSLVLICAVGAFIFPDHAIRLFRRARETVTDKGGKVNVRIPDPFGTDVRTPGRDVGGGVVSTKTGTADPDGKSSAFHSPVRDIDITKARSLIRKGDEKGESLDYDAAKALYKKVEFLNAGQEVLAEAREKYHRAEIFQDLIAEMEPKLLTRSEIVKVYLENGNVFDGTIKKETDTRVEIALNNGVTLPLSRGRIRKIEEVTLGEREKELENIFQGKHRNMEKKNAVAFYTLGKWAYENGLKSRVHEMLTKAAERTKNLKSTVADFFARRLYLRAVWYDTLGQRHNMKKCVENIQKEYGGTRFAMLAGDLLRQPAEKSGFTIVIEDENPASSLAVADVSVKNYKRPAAAEKRPDSVNSAAPAEKKPRPKEKIRMPEVNTSGDKNFAEGEKYLKVALVEGREAMKDLTSRKGQQALVKGRAAVDKALGNFLRAKRNQGNNPELDARINKAMKLKYFFEKSKNVF